YGKIADEDVKVTDEEIKKYVAARPNDFQVEAQADMQYVLFSEQPSEVDINAAQIATTALMDNKVEFNQDTKTNDTILGFSNTKNYEEFVNANSDVPYYDRWMFKSELPATVADTLINLTQGDIYGPYKVDNPYYISKVLETKK